MGIDSYFFVGNFIRVPGVSKVVKNPVHRCSKGCAQKIDKNSWFCGNCGAVVEIYDDGKAELVKLSPYELPASFEEDEFTSPEYCYGQTPKEAIWIPNRGGWGKTFTESSQDKAMNVDLDVKAEIASFTETFSDLLEYIEKTYNVKPVVCWGVVPYSS